MIRRSIACALLFALCGCVARPTAKTSLPNVYVMRHLNTPAGVTDPDLTAEGAAGAQRLAAWLSRDAPTAIFVSDTKRARQTAAPTAQRFGVVPSVYDPRDNPRLIATVLAHKGTVLVIGHSNTVPDIVAGLGGEKPAPLTHEDFGDVWHIHGPTRATVRAKLPDR